MLVGLYIFVDDDDFDRPVHADPDSEELDPELWDAGVEALQDAFDDEGPAQGCIEVAEHWVAWKLHVKMGIAFLAIVSDDVSAPDVKAYLKLVHKAYFDEVDDARNPDRDGVAEVLIDVVAPWEDD